MPLEKCLWRNAFGEKYKCCYATTVNCSEGERAPNLDLFLIGPDMNLRSRPDQILDPRQNIYNMVVSPFLKVRIVRKPVC